MNISYSITKLIAEKVEVLPRIIRNAFTLFVVLPLALIDKQIEGKRHV